MTITSDALVIGITGSFGSGCTTLSSSLKDKGFECISLSEFVREKWQENNTGKSINDAHRPELQDIGNALRKENGNTYLAREAISRLNTKTENISKIVVDSIRHPEEATFLRKTYPYFFLITVDASLEERWQRLKNNYEPKGLTIEHFKKEDKRDAYEDLEYGQKVQICVDDSDIAILNDDHLDPPHAQKAKLQEKIEPYIKLISGQDLRGPSPNESMMALAYAIALRSSCYKRQVGAVIVDENGIVIASACNENPNPLGPCINTYGECYRDIFKKKILEEIRITENCPQCHERLIDNISPDMKCKKCGRNLDEYFIRDRALSRCTALHAEETAIIKAGARLDKCTIYTTTFPCFLCAQKIVATGIDYVVYCESYPDTDSKHLLDKVKEKGRNISISKFEGVKARAYFRLFSLWRSQMEDTIRKRRGA